MGRVEVEWQEDAETLKTLYLSEKDHQGRTRLQALWYLRQGHTIKEKSERIGNSSRTIQNWIAWYRLGGVDEVLGRRHGGFRDGGRRLSPEQIQELKEHSPRADSDPSAISRWACGSSVRSAEPTPPSTTGTSR